MTPKEAEDYVRAQWGQVYHGEDTVVTIYVGGIAHHFLNYIAAAEFTKQREEEIRQKRRERGHIYILVANSRKVLVRLIDYRLNGLVRDQTIDLCRYCRILAVLEAQLAALLLGWKETP